jgi:protein-tyrosine phosphatase
MGESRRRRPVATSIGHPGSMTLELDPPSRHVAFDALFNVRDLGGYRTAGGRTTRWQTLYRADGMNRVGGSDLARLAALGLRTVVDLRTHGELAERGRFPVDAMPVAYHHLPVIRETWENWDVARDVDPVEFLAQRYQEMLDEGAPALAAALEVLADPAAYPAVFHCAAGKDRTGVLAAVILGVLGVDDDTVATDYGLSRAAMDTLVEWLRANVPEALDAMTDQPAAFLDAPPRAMHEVLALVRAEHGSMVGYVASIGVAPATVEALRGNLLS